MYLVCGEALFDVFAVGKNASGALQLEAHAGGSPFNVAIGIARLGVRSALLAGISNDMLGQRLVAELKRQDVLVDYLVRSGNRTTLSLVGVDEHGQPAYLFYGQRSADCSLRPDDLPAIGEKVSALHFGSYSIVVQPVADTFSKLLNSAKGKFISVDPNVRLNIEPDLDVWRERVLEYASRANLVKVSAEDLASLYPGAAADDKALDWLDLGADVVVVTDGPDKISAWTRWGDVVQIEPPAVNVVDTVGAGDSFLSALLVKLAKDGLNKPKVAIDALDRKGLRELLCFAAAAASITCQRRGADLPRQDDLWN